MMERSRSRRTVLQQLASRDRETDKVVQGILTSDRSVDWIPLTLAGGFTNYGGGYAIAAFKRHSSGLVEIKGLVARAAGAPAVGTVIATLPEGFRPLEGRIFRTDAAGAFGRFDIYNNGAIAYIYGAVGYYSIETVFSAEQ
jgi:hypothetical protein